MKNTKLQNPSLRKRKGFTLIELIVVIAILAILAAIAIPAFIGTLNRAKVSTHNANVMSLRSAAQVAIAEKGDDMAGIVWNSESFDSNFIDTWPDMPTLGLLSSASYSVTFSAAPNVSASVLPLKVTADGTEYVS